MSTIEWLARPGTKPESWNPVTGCAKVSAGCKHCYAEVVAGRFWAKQYVHTVGRGFIAAKDYAADHIDGRLRQFIDVMCHEDRLALPLRWKSPRTVFVVSMGDPFHEAVPDEFILNVFTVMAVASRHTFIVLTKRPERMRTLLGAWRADDIYTYWHGYSGQPAEIYSWPLPNVILGVSIEDQATADQRIPLLLQIPAAVRVVSYEPALGPVLLDDGSTSWLTCDGHAREENGGECCESYAEFGEHFHGIDWVIVGGESGPKARPCQVEWIRSTVRQCRDANVAVFVKQLGANTIDRNDAGFEGDSGPSGWPCDTDTTDHPHDHGYQGAPVRVSLRASKGNDINEFPLDLRVREFPR